MKELLSIKKNTSRKNTLINGVKSVSEFFGLKFVLIRIGAESIISSAPACDERKSKEFQKMLFPYLHKGSEPV
jgi:hypothetical protein